MGERRKLFSMQLGSRFRYESHSAPGDQVYVFLDRGGCGLVAHEPSERASAASQGMFSAFDTVEEFREAYVIEVPVKHA